MTPKTDSVAVLRELRVGVEMDAHLDPLGAAKLEAIDAAIAALQAQASAPGEEVTEWRDAFIHVSAMRYIDNGMMHDAAYEAAEQDARVTESANRAALAARTGKGEANV